MSLRNPAGHFRIRDGRIAWADEAAHGLLGYAAGTLAGLPPDQVGLPSLPASGAGGDEDGTQAPAAGPIERGPVALRTRQGHSVLADTRAERMDDGSVLCTFTLLARDGQGERLGARSLRDPLTRLPICLAAPEETRGEAPARNGRSGAWVAVCYLDLDRFRDINAGCGMEGGDAVLVEVARRLRRAVPHEASVARVGGDEFAVALACASRSEGRAVLQRIVAALAEPHAMQGRPACLHASLGVAVMRHGEQPTETMLRAAQQAAFLAKRAGGNQVHFFDARQDRDERQRLRMRQRIAQGLARGEFVLSYQPKVDMRRGVVTGVEALVRWQHPERGLLLPAEFVPCIEDHELVERLGDWALGEAARQLAQWLDEGLRTSVSVNVSPRHLLRPSFMPRLAAHLARHPGLAAGMLELEILESTAIEDFPALSRFIAACGELGVPVTLDDFGTGYSSLAWLRRLPGVALKLDRSFVRGMLDDAQDLAIVRGILLLARSLGCTTTAEGVESVAHGHALMALGCTLGQGYGIARPLPARQVAGWIAQYERAPLWGRVEAVDGPRADRLAAGSLKGRLSATGLDEAGNLARNAVPPARGAADERRRDGAPEQPPDE